MAAPPPDHAGRPTPGRSAFPDNRTRLVAALVALAAVVAVAALASTAGGDLPADGPPEPATPGTPPATLAPAPEPTPPAAPSPETPAAEVGDEPAGSPIDLDEIAEQVSALRGLPLLEPVDARVLDGDELADKVRDSGFGDEQTEDWQADQRLLAALRLIPPDLDLAALVERLLGEQVLGLYVPAEDTLYVRSDGAELSPLARAVAAHEITHALQDQGFDLDALRDLPDEDADAALAVLALIEGDATVTQEAWQQQHQSAEERAAAMAEGLTGGVEVLQQAPRYVRNLLLFPYREGTAFVLALIDAGGLAAVAAAFDEPPTTTREILQPERYLAGDLPEPVGLSLPADPGGDGWDEPRAYTFGQFDVGEWLRPVGEATAQRLASGWAGGRVAHWERAGDSAVALALAFDSAEVTAEVCDSVRHWYEQVNDTAVRAEEPVGGVLALHGDGDVLGLACDEQDVRLGLAPDLATAVRLTEDG